MSEVYRGMCTVVLCSVDRVSRWMERVCEVESESGSSGWAS